MQSRPRVIAIPRGTRTVIELRHKGRALSWLTIHHLTVRVGGARLRTGGIAGVGTDTGHRHKGYSRACMEKSIEFMAGHGIRVSLLFGIPDFYPKWGFKSVIPDPELTVPTREAEMAVPPAGLRIAPFEPERHTRDMIRLYEAANIGRAGPIERPGPIIRPWLKKWAPFQTGSYWDAQVEAFVVLDAGGRVAGYAAHDTSKTEIKVVDAGHATAAVFPAITAELARRAIQRRTGEISLLLPVDHEFARYLHRFNGRHRLRYNRNSNGMARIVRLRDTLRDCAGELSGRLADSRLAGRSFSLPLETDIGKVTLKAVRGRVSVMPGIGPAQAAKMPQDRLTQLLFGYRGVEDVARDPDVRIPDKAFGPLSALFPAGFPYAYVCDRF